MGVSPAQLADVLATTIKDLPKGQFEVMWDSQHYEFCNIYQKHRRKIDGGTSIQRNVVLDRTGTAAYRTLYQADNPTTENVQRTIDVPWTLLGTNYSWDVFELKLKMSSTKSFIDLIETRRTERMWDLSELIEERGWATPENASDKTVPYGIPYYINFLGNGETAGGFNGQTIRFADGSTGTTCAGIDAAAEAKWRNYADTYSAFDTSLLKKLRQAIRRTNFRPSPYAIKPGMDKAGSGDQVKFYANDTVITELENLAYGADDNNVPKEVLGRQLTNGPDDTLYINRRKVCYIPHLDTQTVVDGGGNSFSPDAIYCIDWTKLQPVTHEGYWMEEGEPMMDRGQHTTLTVFLDGSHNNLCINRRTAGFVIHKAIPAA